jgi:hypothetical protein
LSRVGIGITPVDTGSKGEPILAPFETTRFYKHSHRDNELSRNGAMLEKCFRSASMFWIPLNALSSALAGL